jgi:hypothetical protein
MFCTLDEAIARTNLPIRVEFKPEPHSRFYLGYFVIASKVRTKWRAGWPDLPGRVEKATSSYIALRTHLLTGGKP